MVAKADRNKKKWNMRKKKEFKDRWAQEARGR